MLEGAGLGAPDVEAVAAGHDEIVEPHQLLDDRAVASVDHADGAARRELAQDLPHRSRDERVLGAINDRGQHPVVVGEHGGPRSAEALRELLPVAQGVRQVGHATPAPSAPRRWTGRRPGE